MLQLSNSVKYYWYNGAADMRKSFDALCGIVNQHMQLNILQGGVYIFVNKKRNQIKLLTWDGDGLAIYYKRLEKGVAWFRRNVRSTSLKGWVTLVGIFLHSVLPEEYIVYDRLIPSKTCLAYQNRGLHLISKCYPVFQYP